MELDGVQTTLEARFAALRDARAVAGYPLYAIEHGISESDRREVRAALSATLKAEKTPSSAHWLVWLAAAAEVGYGYDGDEYWRSFANEFSGWPFDARETIRTWYSRFVSEFGGVQPQGTWARHRGIIAFPIANSIVPRYLQRLFVQHLSDLRFELAARSDADIADIGELLRDRYIGGFRRFAQFLEQTDLTGRLVLALRDEDVGEVVPRFAPEALARIVRDIEARPRGQALLGRVRRTLRDARVSVHQALRDASASARASSETGRATMVRAGRLVARRSDDGEWHLYQSVTPFEHELERADYSLQNVRVRFRDTTGWMPGGALRTYATGFERLLHTSPAMTSLFVLQPPNAKLENVLGTATSLQHPSPWLLHVRADTATQLDSFHVRAGEAYLIVAMDVPAEVQASLNMQPVVMSAVGLPAYYFDVPSPLSGAHFAALERIGLGHLVTVKVEPVGLLPSRSAEGKPTWLTTEEPMLRLSADYAVSEFSITIGGRRTRVPVTRPSVVVSLGVLQIGDHELEIGAVSNISGVNMTPEQVCIAVRAPVAWKPELPSRAGLRLLTSPVGAGIADIFDKKADLDVRGPSGRLVELSVELFGNDGGSIRKSSIVRAKLPIDPRQLHAALSRLQSAEWSEAMEDAARINVAASMEDLGHDALSFDHAVEPIRWKLEACTNGWKARLINESADADLQVQVCTMKAPARVSNASSATARDGIELARPGALVVARVGNINYPTVMSIMGAGSVASFADLVPDMTFKTNDDDPEEIPKLVANFRMWARAGVLGHLGALRRDKVKIGLHREMAAVACGRHWSNRWSQGMDGEGAVVAGLRSELQASPGFGGSMQNYPWRWREQSDAALAEFMRVADVYRLDDVDEEICRDAAFLAFEPERLRWKDRDHANERMARVARNRALARGAFLAALCDHLRQTGVAIG